VSDVSSMASGHTDSTHNRRSLREIEREKGREARVPILGVSANVCQEKRQAMLEDGMDGYITKPYSFEDMVNRIREMLRKDGDRL
jgi:DNA-binding response OmpR family regulator